MATVCVRIAVDSESMTDLSAVTDNSDTADSLIVESLVAFIGNMLVNEMGYSVSSESVLKNDESVEDFKVTEGLTGDCVISTDSLDCDKTAVLWCAVSNLKVAV